MEGRGTLNFENEKIEFSEGDSILIEPNEKYYYDTEYCKNIYVLYTCMVNRTTQISKIMKGNHRK